MRYVQSIVLIICVMSISSCITYDPRKFKLEPTDNAAVILVKVKNVGIGFNLRVSPFDAEKQVNMASSFTTYATMMAEGKDEGSYIGRTVEPGSYVFQEFSQQLSFAVCFSENTLSFEVKPGEVLYLGEIDASLHFRELGERAVSTGQTSTTALDMQYFFENISPPNLTVASEANGGLEAAQVFLDTQMKNVKGVVKAAKYNKVKFGTGVAFIGRDRTCRG